MFDFFMTHLALFIEYLKQKIYHRQKLLFKSHDKLGGNHVFLTLYNSG